MDNLFGIPVHTSFLAPKDQVTVIAPNGGAARILLLHPWFSLQRGYRPPFYTRYCLGVQEIERDRRRLRRRARSS